MLDLRAPILIIFCCVAMGATERITSEDGNCSELNGKRIFKTATGYESCVKCPYWADLSKERPEAIDEDCWSCCYYTPIGDLRTIQDKERKVRKELDESLRKEQKYHDQSNGAFAALAVVLAALVVSIVYNVLQYKKSRIPRPQQAEDNTFDNFEYCTAT